MSSNDQFNLISVVFDSVTIVQSKIINMQSSFTDSASKAIACKKRNLHDPKTFLMNEH